MRKRKNIPKPTFHIHSNGPKDTITTYYNKEGQELCAIREEQVSDWHFRRYFNNVLIFEAILDQEKIHTPVSVRYLYPGGATMIDYLSNVDDTGWWRLYNEAGQEVSKVPELFKKHKSTYKGWERFTPDADYYVGSNTVPPEWERITAMYTSYEQDINKKR